MKSRQNKLLKMPQSSMIGVYFLFLRLTLKFSSFRDIEVSKDNHFKPPPPKLISGIMGSKFIIVISGRCTKMFAQLTGHMISVLDLVITNGASKKRIVWKVEGHCLLFILRN